MDKDGNEKEKEVEFEILEVIKKDDEINLCCRFKHGSKPDLEGN